MIRMPGMRPAREGIRGFMGSGWMGGSARRWPDITERGHGRTDRSCPQVSAWLGVL